MATLTVRQARLRRHKRVRHKVLGTAEKEGIGGEVICFVW